MLEYIDSTRLEEFCVHLELELELFILVDHFRGGATKGFFRPILRFPLS